MTTYARTFNSRSIMKLNSAARHFKAVKSHAIDWIQSIQPLAVPIRISKETPTTMEFFEPKHFNPPLTEWTEEFSSGVHDLRTSLDALAIEIAYLKTGSVANESKISFPVIHRASDPQRQEAKWRHSQSVKALKENVPESLMDRFKQAQTWSINDPYTTDFLTTLSVIDNEDKHRFGCQINLTPCKLWGSPCFAWASPKDEDVYDTPWLKIEFDQPATPRQVIVDLEDNILPIVSFGNYSAHLFDLQEALFADTYRLIKFIESGTWLPKEPLVLHGTYPIIMKGTIENLHRLQFTGSAEF